MMKKKLLALFLLSQFIVGCQRRTDILDGNWWGIDNWSDYVELYFSDSILYVCDHNATSRIDLVEKSETSFTGLGFYGDTLKYNYEVYNTNHIVIYSNDYKVDLVKMCFSVRTPFNTPNYSNDSILFFEISTGLGIRYQLFNYLKEYNLLEMN